MDEKQVNEFGLTIQPTGGTEAENLSQNINLDLTMNRTESSKFWIWDHLTPCSSQDVAHGLLNEETGPRCEEAGIFTWTEANCEGSIRAGTDAGRKRFTALRC